MHNLANLLNQAFTLHQAGKTLEAINLYLRILPVQKDNDELLFTIGTAYCQIGKLEEGLHYLRKSSRLNPRNFHVFGNIGTLLFNLRRFNEAIINYNKALLINPNFPEGLLGRANAYLEMGAYEEALSDYEKALSLAPNFAIAYCNKGKAEFELGHYEQALDSYSKAVSLAPELAEAFCNQAHALQELNRLDEAISSYRRAISLKPSFEEAKRNLAICLYLTGRTTAAIKSLEDAIKHQPDFLEARWMRAMFTLQIIPASTDQITIDRLGFEDALNQLTKWFDDRCLDNKHKAVGAAQPYYLAYHEVDNKPLLGKYGTLCCTLVRDLPQQYAKKLKANRQPIKVGIVSNHIFQHSVWDALIGGWIEHLDRSRIHLTIFSKFAKHDEATDFARSSQTDLIKCNEDYSWWINAIQSNQIDVLIYPEIGMDAMAIKLASMRLAPIQIASWGHPETTGLPSIDYYLSADMLEPKNSEAYYTEALVRLPNLGCCIKKSDTIPKLVSLSDLGISGGQPLFICPGTPFKYNPEHDHVFVNIANRLNKCQFVFFTYKVKELTTQLKERIASSFSKAGLNFNDFCVFVPWQSKDAFYGLMKQADVYLDTIGFSGFNTAMQAIECQLPIVTREGKFMRGRLASGILKKIDLAELVTKNQDAYVDLAVQLATDHEYNRTIRKKITSKQNALYDDLEPIRALEQFIEDAFNSKL